MNFTTAMNTARLVEIDGKQYNIKSFTPVDYAWLVEQLYFFDHETWKEKKEGPEPLRNDIFSARNKVFQDPRLIPVVICHACQNVDKDFDISLSQKLNWDWDMVKLVIWVLDGKDPEQPTELPAK